MEFFDSHSHYNDEKYNIDRNDLLQKIYDEGITRTVCVGYNTQKSQMALEIANKYSYIYASCGISPNDIKDFSVENLEVRVRCTIKILIKNVNTILITIISFAFISITSQSF